MKVLIIGYGTVGKAVASVFKRSEITIIDPKYNTNKIVNYKNNYFDIVFVCVDTPYKDKFRLLEQILSECNEYLKNNIICCKSTASPLFYRKVISMYKNIHLIFYPEFLSHWSNIADFKNQEYIILGGKKSIGIKIFKILKNKLKKLKKVFYVSIESAAFIKYCENYFLALKVTFANDIFKIYKKLNIVDSFNINTFILGTDKRIGRSHFQVPGRDNKFGWGGHCFPKDIKELIDFSDSSLAKFIIKLNKKHRNT